MQKDFVARIQQSVLYARERRKNGNSIFANHCPVILCSKGDASPHPSPFRPPGYVCMAGWKEKPTFLSDNEFPLPPFAQFHGIGQQSQLREKRFMKCRGDDCSEFTCNKVLLEKRSAFFYELILMKPSCFSPRTSFLLIFCLIRSEGERKEEEEERGIYPSSLRL